MKEFERGIRRKHTKLFMKGITLRKPGKEKAFLVFVVNFVCPLCCYSLDSIFIVEFSFVASSQLRSTINNFNRRIACWGLAGMLNTLLLLSSLRSTAKHSKVGMRE